MPLSDISWASISVLLNILLTFPTLYFYTKKKLWTILDMGFSFLMFLFWCKGFFTTLLSVMPVYTCCNLLSINLKAYNYKAGNDAIILKCLHENKEWYNFKVNIHILFCAHISTWNFVFNSF